MAALRTVKLPAVSYDPELDTKVVDDTQKKPLQIYSSPVSTTFAIFDSSTVVTDPTLEEENLCSGMVSVVVKDDELCSVLKSGGSPLSDDKLLDCVKISKKRGMLLNKLIDTALLESNDE